MSLLSVKGLTTTPLHSVPAAVCTTHSSHSSLTGELERTQRSEELAVGLLFYVADVQPVCASS